MVPWLLFAIASIFCWGLFNFGMKVMQQRQYNVSFITLLSSFSWTVVSWIYCLSKYWINWPTTWGYLLLLIAFWNTIFYFLSIQTRVKSLQNIDTTIFFPLHKTFWPIFALIVGLLFFKEWLTIKELVWIVIWIIIPLLLLTKSENRIQKNLKLGVTFVFFTSILAWISWMFPKLAQLQSINIDVFTFFMFFFWTIVTAFSYYVIENKKNKVSLNKELLLFWWLLWILYFLAVYTFNVAMQWNYAVVITINSFSILIPIILSVIFYKEEMTKKKAFVIFLSIVSVILFI